MIRKLLTKKTKIVKIIFIKKIIIKVMLNQQVNQNELLFKIYQKMNLKKY